MEKPGKRTHCLKREAWSWVHCFAEEMAFLREDLEKAGSVRREMSSSALFSLRVEAIEEMQGRSCSRWERIAGCGGEGEEREGM